MKEEKLYDATDLNISFEQGRLRGEKDIKDALLEWAEEEMMKAARSSEAYGRRNAFMDVIDKINSL